MRILKNLEIQDTRVEKLSYDGYLQIKLFFIHQSSRDHRRTRNCVFPLPQSTKGLLIVETNTALIVSNCYSSSRGVYLMLWLENSKKVLLSREVACLCASVKLAWSHSVPCVVLETGRVEERLLDRVDLCSDLDVSATGSLKKSPSQCPQLYWLWSFF